MEVSLSRLGARPSVDASPVEVARSRRASAVPSREFEPVRHETIPGDGYARLRARSDEVNALAQAIRQGGVQGDIRKLYPPYPPGQEARLDDLDRLPGLRKQIEVLRYPVAPREEVVGDSLATRDEGIAGDIGEAGGRQLAGLDGRLQISMNRRILEDLAWEPSNQ